jgi:hypothetical protein
MNDGHYAMGKRSRWRGIILMLASLLVLSAVPGHARVGVFIGPTIAVPFGPFWAPYWAPYPYAYPYGYPYAYPPVVVQPSPQVSVQPPPSPPSWYYCDNPKGYYPYVQQCRGGWRQVPAQPQ